MLGEQAYDLEGVTDAGHSFSGDQVWFKLRIAGSDQFVPVTMSPVVLSNLIATSHQLAQSAAVARVKTQGPGRPGPMPMIEVERSDPIDLFDPSLRGIRLHIRNSSTLDLAFSKMGAAQAANHLKGRSRTARSE